MTFKPETLKSHRLKRLRLEPSFQWKLQWNTLAERLGSRGGNMSQNGPKTSSLMTSLTQNLQPPNQKIFFECRQEDSWWIWALAQLSSAIGGAMPFARQ